ncbi:MAG: hypothetical protein ACRD0G_15910 [Acidimicrobiales bacterium]
MLEDGSYDAIVVDADQDGAAVVLSITIVAGASKGEVVDVRAARLGYEPMDLLAMPCVLVVREGEPHVMFD